MTHALLFAFLALQQGAVPKLRLVPEAKIDGAAADLSGVGSTMIMRDNGLVFVEPQDFRLRFYDANGKELARFGRRGEGPGEFSMGNQISPIQAPVRLGLIGDTVWAFNARRFTLISKDGKLIRTFAQPAALPGGGGMTGSAPAVGSERIVLSFSPEALASGNAMIGRTTWGHVEIVNMGGRETRMQRGAENGYAVAAPTGEITKVLAMSPSSVTPSTSVIREGRSWGVPTPFIESRYQSISPDGSRIAFGTTTFASEKAGTLNIVVIGVRGDTLLNKNLAFAPVAITKHVADSAVDDRMRMYRPAADAKGPPPAPPDVVSEIESKMRAAMPKSASVYRSMFIAADNSIWLLGARHADGGREVFILDERGNMVGAVSVGKSTFVGAASTRTMIWAVESDENDVSSFVRYRVTK